MSSNTMRVLKERVIGGKIKELVRVETKELNGKHVVQDYKYTRSSWKGRGVGGILVRAVRESKSVSGLLFKDSKAFCMTLSPLERR